MKLIVLALLAGGAVALPNPEVGECEFADVVVTRSEPTLLDPEGAVTGIRIWQVCSYQERTGVDGGIRAVDDEFVVELDRDTATLVVEAADEMLAGDGAVYLP